MDWDVDEYELPAPGDVIQEMRTRSNALADLASLPTKEIVANLRKQWRFENLPHLTNLANAILDLPLSCLSVCGEQYWLTFNKSSYPLSIVGANNIPQSLFHAFPISSVHGLQEFLSHFGGMADGVLPPGGFFWPPSAQVFVSKDDPRYDWGVVGRWAGSLAFYHGASGDQIVIHPEGYPGKWSHEIAWEKTMGERLPFVRLNHSVVELIDEFVNYMSITIQNPMNPSREFSPFLY